MFLQQLEISGFRNLKHQRLQLNCHFNAFCGLNGSGKTSILEAIHVLGAGRSFRTTCLQHVIQLDQPRYALGGQIAQNIQNSNSITNIGTEKTLSGNKIFKIAGKNSTAAEVARLLPLQTITADSHKLIDAGPEYRRKFIDWAMFHMEHEFWATWQAFNQGLIQRNAVLKQSGGRRGVAEMLAAWQAVFVAAAVKIDLARKAVVCELQPIVQDIISAWLPGRQVELCYKQGWELGEEFASALTASLDVDLLVGFTSKGPHRADMELLIDGVQAKVFLSRGQQKLLVCALLLARTTILAVKQQKHSVFLVDDLHAELDAESSRMLLQGLVALKSQIFVTNIDQQSLLQGMLGLVPSVAVFKVAKGEIAEV